MRILVVGAGATGGYFGGRLAQAGRDVTFLVRGARAEQLRRDGLVLVSPHGDATLAPNLVTAGAIAAPYEVILLAVKAYALAAAMDDVQPAVGPATMIVPVLNGMRHLDLLAARFGDAPVLGGVCAVTTTVDDQGRIVQLSDIQQLIYGERDGSISARLTALDALLQKAGFTAQASPEILQAMWHKWILLASLGGITCLLRGAIGQIEAAPGGADLALTLLEECASVATASGHAPREEFLATARPMLTAPGSPLTTSMYRDLTSGREVEAEQILGDMLDRARGFGLDTPILAAAYANLCVYRNSRPR